MSNKYSSNQKVCANCTFWMGERKTDLSRSITECVPNTKGDCHEGGMKRTGKMNNATCSKWQKWGGVK